MRNSHTDPLFEPLPTMRLHSPSMSELHAFAAAVRLGSFSKAAIELCVTQSAISRAVARLEFHYGKPLLLRRANAMALTDAGQQLLDAVREPLAAIEAASARLRESPADQPLNLSVVPTLASVWLIPRLKAFQQQHPEVHINFVPYRKDEDFSGPTPDAAVLTGLGPTQWPHWDCDYLIGREVVPICHPARLAQRQAAGAWRSPGELADEPLLYHTTAPGNWAQWLQAAGAPERAPRLSTAFDQVSMLIQAVIADMGVALVQRCLVSAELASGAVAVPFDLPITLARGYFLCAPSGQRRKPALTAFRHWLLQTAQADVAALNAALRARPPDA